MNFKRIVFIGAGNLATHLSVALKGAGCKIVQVFSRTETSAKLLAEKLECSYTNHIDNITIGATHYIFAVSDSVIEGLCKSLIESNEDFRNKVFLHTAGSIHLNVFEPFTRRYGVFYPLQTFSKASNIEFADIPLCIESNSVELETELLEIAKKISNNVQQIDSEQRGSLHLSAVFVCNFVNHLYALGSDIVEQFNVSFDLLRPLIAETAAKVQKKNPVDVQTGPAVRSDKNVIDKHIAMLSFDNELSNLYKILSQSIFKKHK